MLEQFVQNRRLIAHYYIAIGLAALLFGWKVSNEATIDAAILIVLAVYVLVFPVVILYTRKYAVHIFLFLLALITGFYSFYHYSVESHSILNALYFTFQLFLLVVTDVFTEDGSSLLHYPFIVEIARWSAASYTISTLFIAMYRLLETSILLVFYQVMGNHYVVFGYNENSVAFIEDLRKNKKRVILVADGMTNEAIDYLERLKVVVLHPRDKGENIYTKCRLPRAKAVVLLHEEDVDNLNVLMDIQYYFKEHSKKNLGLTVYVHLQEVTSRKLFLDLEGTIMEQDRHFQVQLINLYEIFVDALFKKYPIYSSYKEEEPIHIFIIGFGPLGQHIALKAASQSRQIEKNALQITAVDKNMSKIKQNWERNYGGVNKEENITLRSFDVEVDRLESLIIEQDLPMTHIYVCLHEDNLDLLAGIELSNQLPHIPIYLEFSEGSIADKWIQSEVSGTRLIYGTGTFKDILTEGTLLNLEK
ncbi:hypothetical protein ACXYMX_16470 [Sporosarcina sp. CAU 1771]